MSHYNHIIDYSIECNTWKNLLEQCSDLFQRIVTQAIKEAEPDLHDAEISIVLADDAFIQKLNKQYRHKDKPTNVLSFPQIDDWNDSDITTLPSPVALGDIIIAYETVEREAAEQNKTIEAHTAHMVCHGILHLLGYDHIEDDEADAMESLEIKILTDNGLASPYNTAL